MSGSDNMSLKAQSSSGMQGGDSSHKRQDTQKNQIDQTSHLNPENPENTDITKAQLAALDKILYDNRTKYSESSEYSTMYDYSKNELDVDFIDKGNLVVRVMDKHNFYEAELMPEDYLNDAPIGLMTKLWISISKLSKQ